MTDNTGNRGSRFTSISFRNQSTPNDENTADNEIGSGDCLSVFLYLIIFYSDGERSVEFGMLIAAAAFVDDVTVEVRAYQRTS